MKLLLIILCGVVLPSYAQKVLTGKVVDESNKSVPSATIQVLTTDSAFVSGEVTDNDGNFRIKTLDAGNYILAVSCIGYTKSYINFEMPVTDYMMPMIVLRDDNVLLDAVTVTGSSFIQKDNHLLVIPDKQSVKHAFSGYDLLHNLMIPGLQVDRKEKKVTAITGEATLYINGVKAEMREVENLKPEDIKQVEYYTLPVTGSFVGDNAAINYITKVHQTGGYVTLDGTQNIGYTKGNYNLGAKISDKNMTYTFFAGAAMQKHDGVEQEKQESMALTNELVDCYTHSDDASYKNNQQYAQFKMSHDTEKHHLSASLAFVRNETPLNREREILQYGQNQAQIYQSENLTFNNKKKYSASLNGLFHISDVHEIKAYLTGSYSNNHYNRNYLENELTSITKSKEDLFEFEPYIAYTFQPDKSNSLYSRIWHAHKISSVSYQGDYDYWQHLWNGETVLLVDYTHLFGDKFTLMFGPGISWQNYKLHGDKLFSKLFFRTNSWLRYNMTSKQWIAMGFSMGNNQPGINYLNNVNQTVDRYKILRGNPNLDNTQYLNYYLIYEGTLHRYFNLQGNFGFNQNKHQFYDYYFLEQDKIIHSYDSKESFNVAQADIRISSRFSDNLRTNIGVCYRYMYVPEVKSLSQHSVIASIDINYFIKSFAINAYAKTTEKILNETTRAFIKSPASYGLSVRYSGKNWMAEVGTDNPFTRHVHYREYADYGVYRYNQVQTSRIYQQTAYIKLAYTFDFGEKTSREEKNIDANINSAILKAR